MKVFAMNERPLPFVLMSYLCIYSVEYTCQGTAMYIQYPCLVKTNELCKLLRMYTRSTKYTDL